MKIFAKYCRFVGVLCLYFITNSIEASEGELSEDQKVLKIMKSIKVINKKIENDFLTLSKFTPNEVVITIGGTGEGKSTLMNFLAGKPLEVKKDRGFKIFVSEPIPGMEISNNGTPGTRVPHYWYDQSLKRVYYDCPGFGDPRTADNDIINAYAINKLFETFSPIKILVVTREDSLIGRAKSFQDNIKIIAEFFQKEDIACLSKACCTVVTRQNEFEIEDVSPTFGDLAEAKDLNLSEQTRALLRKLKENSHIAFFPKPEKVGSFLVSGTEAGDETKDLILQAIENTSCLENILPTIVVSAESKNFIITCTNKLNQKITDYITSTIVPKIYKYTDKKIQGHTESIEVLRESFREFSKDIDNIDSSSLKAFEHGLRHVLSTCSSEALYKKIQQITNYINFFKKINENVHFQCSDWKMALHPLTENIKKLAHLPECNLDKNIFVIKGFLLGTSDLNCMLKEKTNNLSNISLISAYGLNALLIDEDIIQPGVSLSLISPTWNIIEGRTINLRGRNGPDQDEKARKGLDGLPGHAGESGGSFYGKGREFVNLEKLTINVSGGNGGNGQDGYIGEDGAPGEDGESVTARTGDIIDRVEYDIYENKPGEDHKFKEAELHVILNNSKQYFSDRAYDVKLTGELWIYKNKGNPGEEGGNGGRGGKGGKGGKTGFCLIENEIKPLLCFSVIKEDGNDSEVNGTPGKGGRGGKYGNDCVGDFIFAPKFTYYHYYKPWEYAAAGIPTLGIGAGIMGLIQCFDEKSFEIKEGIWKGDIEYGEGIEKIEENNQYALDGVSPSKTDLNIEGIESPKSPKTIEELKKLLPMEITFEDPFSLEIYNSINTNLKSPEENGESPNSSNNFSDEELLRVAEVMKTASQTNDSMKDLSIEGISSILKQYPEIKHISDEKLLLIIKNVISDTK